MSRSSFLLHHGTVYAPSHPHSAAMLVDGATVAWVGSDEAGRAFASPDTEPIDLAGRLVTPGFVDGWRWPADAPGRGDDALRGAAAERLGAAARAGVVLLVVTTGSAAAAGAVAAESGAAHRHPETAVVWDEALDGVDRARRLAAEVPRLAGFGIAADGTDEALARHIAAATDVGLPALVRAGTAEQAARALDAFAAVAADRGAAAVQGAHHGVVLGAGVPASRIGRLVELGIAVLVDPVSHPEVACAPLAAAGVTLVLSGADEGGQTSPWTRVHAVATDRPDNPAISARAAFRAHSRAAWRVLAAVSRPGSGTIAPGAPASCVVWSPGSLVVEAPDDRVQTWSTDPRSGTPPLPALSAAPPHPELTLLNGIRL